MMRRNWAMSDLEGTINSTILKALDIKITNRGIRVKTTIKQVNCAISELTNIVVELLEKERNKTPLRNPKGSRYPFIRGKYNANSKYLKLRYRRGGLK